ARMRTLDHWGQVPSWGLRPCPSVVGRRPSDFLVSFEGPLHFSSRTSEITVDPGTGKVSEFFHSAPYSSRKKTASSTSRSKAPVRTQVSHPRRTPSDPTSEPRWH